MEKVQAELRAILRLVLFILLAIAYFAISLWIDWTDKDDVRRRQRFSRNATRFARIICKILNINVIVKNPISPSTVGLVVGNHLGFVDIFAACSLIPSLFVTSQEMHEIPLVGRVTEFGGCVYVERRKRSNIMQELDDMVQFLRIGFRVVLYPEATSHNGEVLLPFKRTLLTSAAFAGVPIIPYVFNFKTINGEPFTLKNRDLVCYYGDIRFDQSLHRIFRLKEITCEIEFLPEVKTTPDDNRAEVADRLRQMISEKFIPVKS